MLLSAFVLAALPAAGPGHTVTAVAPADGGKLLFVAMSGSVADNGWVCTWDLTKPELKAVVTGVPSNVRTIQPTADGKRFVLIGGDVWHVTHFAVWDTATKKPLHVFDVPAKDAALASVSSDGNWVAYRSVKENTGVRVWNTDTGKRVEEVEKTVGKTEGALAFSPDSKRLVVATQMEHSEFDLVAGKKAGGWKRTEPPQTEFREYGGMPVILPNGKGVVTVSATGKRRQSYVVRLVTEKKDWFLGEFWDRASPPIVSPDGRLLIVSGGGRADDAGTFVLKLDADGNPETEDPPAKPVGPFAPADGKKVAAWREWTLREATRAGRTLPGPLAVSADGKRLFVVGTLGRLQVYDTDKRVPKATLFATVPKKDELPGWYIVTAAGECVGSAAEVESLVTGGKVKDAAKVKDALGMK